MKKNPPLVHDTEREPGSWLTTEHDGGDLSVTERAYRAVVQLLLSSGLRGINAVKTAEIARLSGVNESTLFRNGSKRDQLVAEAVDWCWAQVNDEIAATHRKRPLIDSTAADLIRTDLLALLDMFDTDSGRLVGTGALLSFRRAEQITEGFDCPHQMEFRDRLGLLAAALVKDCDTGDHDPSVIATYLTNYVATVWFTWLADPSSRNGLLDRGMVRDHLQRTLDTYASCALPIGDVRAS